jgi:hypothetical protein
MNLFGELASAWFKITSHGTAITNGTRCASFKRFNWNAGGKGNCYDNVPAEFFHPYKFEAVHGERFPVRDGMELSVFEHVA